MQDNPSSPPVGFFPRFGRLSLSADSCENHSLVSGPVISHWFFWILLGEKREMLRFSTRKANAGCSLSPRGSGNPASSFRERPPTEWARPVHVGGSAGGTAHGRGS